MSPIVAIAVLASLFYLNSGRFLDFLAKRLDANLEISFCFDVSI